MIITMEFRISKKGDNVCVSGAGRKSHKATLLGLPVWNCYISCLEVVYGIAMAGNAFGARCE